MKDLLEYVTFLIISITFINYYYYLIINYQLDNMNE